MLTIAAAAALVAVYGAAIDDADLTMHAAVICAVTLPLGILGRAVTWWRERSRLTAQAPVAQWQRQAP